MSTVSVVIPTYNRGSYLPRAIDSVLEQTYDDLEPVVVDDGSTDDTPEIIDQYEDPRIEYIQHETNRGANAARNTGIEVASGSYLSLLDSDDRFHPQYLEKTISRFESSDRDDFVGVFTSFRVIEEDESTKEIQAKEGQIQSLEMFEDGRVGTFSCVTFETDIFEKIGLLDEDLVSCQDLDFYIRVLKEYNMIGINEVLVDYYSHDGNLSTDVERRLEGQKAVLDKHRRTLSPEFRGELHYAIADRLARLDRPSEARSHLREAIRADRWNPFYPLQYVALRLGKRPYHASCYIREAIK